MSEWYRWPMSQKRMSSWHLLEFVSQSGRPYSWCGRAFPGKAETGEPAPDEKTCEQCLRLERHAKQAPR
jgi:hypothetical protein